MQKRIGTRQVASSTNRQRSKQRTRLIEIIRHDTLNAPTTEVTAIESIRFRLSTFLEKNEVEHKDAWHREIEQNCPKAPRSNNLNQKQPPLISAAGVHAIDHTLPALHFVTNPFGCDQLIPTR